MFAPPFRDPFNYNFDPLIPIEHRSRRRRDGAPVRRRRQARRDQPQGFELLDVVERRPAHDGLLPQHDRPADRDDRQPDADHAFRSSRRSSCRIRACTIPIEPQDWHFRQSIDYSLTANCAVLRHRLAQPRELPLQHLPDGEELDRARQPRQLDAHAAARDRRAGGARGGGGGEACRRRRTVAGGGRPAAAAGWRVAHEQFKTLLRDPGQRDPRGYILPSDQPDFPTATKFINALIKTGVIVHRATAAFTVGGKTYPAGSYVVKSGAGVPAARARHVRAAGSSRRHSRIRAVRRRGPTTTPAGRSPIRWA